jgi:hypothetical protein
MGRRRYGGESRTACFFPLGVALAWAGLLHWFFFALVPFDGPDPVPWYERGRSRIVLACRVLTAQCDKVQQVTARGRASTWKAQRGPDAGEIP